LIHQPLISGVLHGSASDLDIHARDIINTKHMINQLYASETGRDLAEVQAATDRDNWMTAQEAKAFGLDCEDRRRFALSWSNRPASLLRVGKLVRSFLFHLS
jgi:hypothetical protein